MSLNSETSEINDVFDYNNHIMGIGGIVSLSDADPVALRLKRCREGLGHFSGKVLEIGCGAGRMVKNLKFYSPAIEIHGCDISYQAIHRASRDAQQVANFTVADVQTLPYADESFDIVVGFDIIEHVPDVQRTVTEAYRVLRKGGRFHLHAPCEGNPWTFHWLLYKFVTKRDLKRIYAGHIQKLTYENLKSLLFLEGFHINNISYSWHWIGQLADLEQYLLMDIKTRSTGKIKIYMENRNFLTRILGLFEDTLRYFTIRESNLLKKIPLAMGIHITCEKAR